MEEGNVFFVSGHCASILGKHWIFSHSKSQDQPLIITLSPPLYALPLLNRDDYFSQVMCTLVKMAKFSLANMGRLGVRLTLYLRLLSHLI